jgi:hypothetical protein
MVSLFACACVLRHLNATANAVRDVLIEVGGCITQATGVRKVLLGSVA